MIPLGDKHKREREIMNHKIGREYDKHNREEARKDEVHQHKLQQEKAKTHASFMDTHIKLKKGAAEVAGMHHDMKHNAMKNKAEIDAIHHKNAMEKQKMAHDHRMDMADRKKESERGDQMHHVDMAHKMNENQLKLHEKAAQAHIKNQIAAKTATGPEGEDGKPGKAIKIENPREIPEVPAFKPHYPKIDIPKSKAYGSGTHSVEGYHHGGIVEEKALGQMGAKMASHPPKPMGYWWGTDEVKEQKEKQQANAMGNYMKSTGVPGNYTLGAPPPPSNPGTGRMSQNLSSSLSPVEKWERINLPKMNPQQQQEYYAQKKAQGYSHGVQEIPRMAHNGIGAWGFAHGTPSNPEAGPSDTVPAMLTPGEAVIPREAAQDPKYKPIIKQMINHGRRKQKGYAEGVYEVPGYEEGIDEVPTEEVAGSPEDSSVIPTAPNASPEQVIHNNTMNNSAVDQKIRQDNADKGVQPIADVTAPPQAPINTAGDPKDKPAEPPPTPEAARATAADKALATREKAIDQRFAQLSAGRPKEEAEGIFGNLLDGFGKTFGFNNQEMNRMALLAAGSYALGYSPTRAIRYASKQMMQESHQRQAEEAKDQRAAANQAAKDTRDHYNAIEKEKLQEKRLEAREDRETEKARVKSRDAAIEAEYKRLIEENPDDSSARQKAIQLGYTLYPQMKGGQAVGPDGRPLDMSVAPSNNLPVHQGTLGGKQVTGQLAGRAGRGKTEEDVVVTNAKGEKTHLQVESFKHGKEHIPYVYVPDGKGGLIQEKLSDFKARTKGQFQVDAKAKEDTAAGQEQKFYDRKRQAQQDALQLESNSRARRAEVRAEEAHAQSQTTASRAANTQAVNNFKGLLPKYGPDGKELHLNEGLLASAMNEFARQTGRDPNDPSLQNLSANVLHDMIQDGSYKNMSPEALTRAMRTQEVTLLSAGGDQLRPKKQLKGSDAAEFAENQSYMGRTIAAYRQAHSSKSDAHAFNEIYAAYNKLSPRDKKNWEDRAGDNSRGIIEWAKNNLK